MHLDENELRSGAQRWLDEFERALVESDLERLASSFDPDCYWRDILSFTWDIRTRAGAPDIAGALIEKQTATHAAGFVVESVDIGELADSGPVLQVFFEFQTAAGRGRGFARLREHPVVPGTLCAWTLLTTLQQLRGFEERLGRNRPRQQLHNPDRGVANWLDNRARASRFEDDDPQVVIVGAGQAGLTLAARLGRLNVSTLVVDRIERIGDNWRHRYHSLALHNETCVNHMPYLPFPRTWPIYLPKDMLADWFEFYAFAMELNVWTGTEFVAGTYDGCTRRWSVRLRRPDGTVRDLKSSHVVMAIGISGIPCVPDLQGAVDFRGQILHSSAVPNDLDVADKQVLVVGAGNSAHDLAQDIYQRGGHVTMLQRSSTTVVSLEPSAAKAFKLYSDDEDVRPLEDTDLMSASVPNQLLKRLHVPLSRKMAEDDAELLDGLHEAGFVTDNGEDDTGFYIKSQRYFGGYYLNTGASDLIIRGDIKVRHAAGIDHFTSDAAVLTDGTTFITDLVVLATGYHPLQEGARRLFGGEVADRLGPIWGLDEEDELNNMWRPTAQEGLFVLGGSFAQARIFSHYVALQIKAALEGLTATEDQRTRREEMAT